MANVGYRVEDFGKKSKRRNYSKIRSRVDVPDLIEIQTKSFDEFVTSGLEKLLNDISPISSTNQDLKLYFGACHFEDPKYSVVESRLRRTNYSRPLKVMVRLENAQTGTSVENELFMGDIPFMTPVGTFIINGAERVIISQIIRSAGVYYSKDIDKKTGDTKFSAQIFPTRGAWLEYEAGSRNIFYGKLDRSKKVPLTTMLRAFGLGTNEQIEELFGTKEFFAETYEKETSLAKGATINAEYGATELYSKLRQGEAAPVEGSRIGIADKLFNGEKYDLQEVGRFKFNVKLDVLQRAKGLILSRDVLAADDVFDEETGEVLFEKGQVIASKGQRVEGEVLETLKKARAGFRYQIDCGNTFDSDAYETVDSSSRCADPYQEILYVDVTVGDETKEVKIVGNDQRETALHITLSDILASISYFINLYQGAGNIDDIDNLGNRRLRLIGELLRNQFRVGFGKLKKNIKDRMSLTESEKATPSNLINIKPLTSTLKEFFGSSQLSQFMDQINPLAEITQKRRISALGSGGIQRDRAGTEVRDVHNSHYGRMCPIETPEGPSVGLITSLASYAKIDKYGFIEAPYFKAYKDENGETYFKSKQVTDWDDKKNDYVTNLAMDDAEIEYLTAFDEDGKVIAAASTKLEVRGDRFYIVDETIIGRRDLETEMVSRTEVDYMDVAPRQIVSVAASCVPFLEHDDATRALMGANMQRQAVPIIAPESPIVGTGMEYRAAKDSGAALCALGDGVVEYADAKKIIVKETSGDTRRYDLYQFLRSNSSTAIIQRPIVKAGEVISRGDVIADGQSMKDGELALGRNVRIAFMTWEGYNFEDAVIMSERMVYDDVYTSLHIEDYDIEARDTKLGPEEFTREIPNVGEDAKKNLDEYGIVRVGTEVKEGDILVGKTTPKGQTDPTPEEKLLLQIFGEKSRDVKDSSLRVPHGGGGVVQSIQHFYKKGPDGKKDDSLNPTVNEVVRVFILQKRKIQVGDKMAGRHGNKGVISNILPVEDMPFSEDGRPIDIMLNPQGVPSRMNIGQVLELHLGIAAKKLGVKVATPAFDGATIEDIEQAMADANMPADGMYTLYDGRSGEPFENKISVGIMYFIKLSHMVDDKLHARNVGKYTLVTQQPMGGKAQNGGQRFGEMEVWALQAYGAAHTLREMMTIKSDDLVARDRTFDAIVDGKPIPESSIPESFRVLTRELQSLGIHVELINQDGENEVNRSIVDFKIKNVETPRVKYSLTKSKEELMAEADEK